MTRLLLVCTANRCRSPIAEAFMRQYLPASATVDVASGGLIPGGEPMPPMGVEIMRGFGLDLSAHRSTQVTAGDLTNADLILTMTRSHARSLVAQAPDVWPRCYPLKRFVREAATAAIEPSLQKMLDELGKGRSVDAILGSSSSDEVPDPMRRKATTWMAVVEDLRAQTEQLTRLLLAVS